MNNKPDVICLFSGGLDSLLAALLLQKQNLNVLCLHFTSPFFGSPHKLEEWRANYGLDIRLADLSLPFAEMLLQGPPNGVGRHLNPCVDCKILQLRHARQVMQETGARFLATGEVLGQRPMSQRRDSLQKILNEANAAGQLLRPLSARLLPETPIERSGLVNREELMDFSGRGRNPQLALARQFGIKNIPSPGGGCKLTEKENTRRYWQVLKKRTADCRIPDLASDFHFANLGRQFWRETENASHWLAIGRTAQDNEQLRGAQKPGDLALRVANIPGPLGIARKGSAWSMEILREAAALLAAHSPKARGEALVRVIAHNDRQKHEFLIKQGESSPPWGLQDWESVHQEILASRHKNLLSQKS